MEVTRIKKRKDGVKYCLIKKSSNLKENDLVKINKLEEEDGRR